ncbi:MAG: TolC family protein [Flavobacteriaceae bacterium]|nr:TolC family protein [Flavobacteriaceae bacterium]
MYSFKMTFNDIAKELGISYEIIPFKSAADIISGIPSDVDAFYLAGGFFFNKSEIKQLADKLANEKIPSFTSTNTRDVELGLMATHQSKEHLSRFFRRISLHIESYIGGKDFSELPLNLKYENKLTINYNTAEKVGVPIKYSLLTSTDFIGNFKNVLSKKKYTLLDVINEVLNKNLSLASDRKDIALNKQDVKLAKSSYYPDISFSTLGTYVDPDLAEISGGQNPEYSTSGDVILTQVLFSEELNAAIDIQKNLLKAQKEYYNSNQLDAVFNASNSYFNVLILKTNLHIQKQNLDLTKKNLQIANQNFEAGQTGKSDVLRFRSEMAQNTQVFVEAANQLEQAYFRLNQLLNNPINHEIDVEDLEFGKGILEQYDYKELRAIFDHPKMRSSFVDYLTLKAKENAPELKLMDYNLLVTTRTIKLNGRGRFFPILALQGQYNRDFNQWGTGSTPSPLLKKNYNIGLKLSIPIFQQNKKNINKQTAIIEQEQLLINKANIALNISANVHIAVLKLIDEISNIETSNASEAAAKEGLLLTQTAYSSGAITIVELLDSQNNYLFAQLSKVNSTYNYLLNSLQLERYINHYFLLKTPQQNQDFILGFYNYFQQKN